MSNIVFGWPIFSDPGELYSPTLSGGSWEATLPLVNLQDDRLHLPARSVDDAAASTQFEVDLGVARSVRVVALVKMNISSVGTVRVRGSNTAGDFTGAELLYDSGTTTPYPSGGTAETLEDQNINYVHVLAAATSSRYWLVEVTDTTNPDTYIQIGRLVIAGGWQPSINMSTGAKLSLETATTRTQTDGGAKYSNRKPTRRGWMFTTDHLPEAEAFASGFDMQRIAGTDRQIYFVHDPADTTQMHRRSGLVTLRELTALEYPYAVGFNAMAWALEEVL